MGEDSQEPGPSGLQTTNTSVNSGKRPFEVKTGIPSQNEPRTYNDGVDKELLENGEGKM